MSMGIGWPNASAYSGPPVPIYERYYVSDCVGYVGDFTTVDYTIGTYQLGDRVTYEKNGYNSFGLIDSITTNVSDDIEITSTGINTNVCFDNQLHFNSNIYREDTQITVDFDCYPYTEDFDGTDSDYAIHYIYNIQIYYTYSDGESDNQIFIQGTINDANYYFIQGQNNYLGTAVGEMYVLPDYWEIVYEDTQPYFSHTNSYTANDCNEEYFMRENGYTFSATFPTQC